MRKLSDQEYKKLVIDVAIAISPKIIELKKVDSDIAAVHIARYAVDIADAVNDILKSN